MDKTLVQRLVSEDAKELVRTSFNGETWAVYHESADARFFLVRQTKGSTSVTWATGFPALLYLLRTSEIPSPAMAELAWEILRGVSKA